MGADLSLSAVLERIVEFACELVGARYGALGIDYIETDFPQIVQQLKR